MSNKAVFVLVLAFSANKNMASLFAFCCIFYQMSRLQAYKIFQKFSQNSFLELNLLCSNSVMESGPYLDSKNISIFEFFVLYFQNKDHWL